MSNEVFYGRMKAKAACGLTLEYYMIEESICDDYCDLMSYGVRVVKTMYSGGGGKTVESKQINNIFYRKADAEGFLKLIMRNKVTPVTLMDVVEDYIIETIDETA